MLEHVECDIRQGKAYFPHSIRRRFECVQNAGKHGSATGEADVALAPTEAERWHSHRVLHGSVLDIGG